MEGKRIKKLKRIELLEILSEQIQINEDLKQEIDRLSRELEDKEIKIAEAGSLAEASLKLNRVFEAVQKTAEQYLHNAAERSKAASEDKAAAERDRLEAHDLLEDIRSKSAALISKADEEASVIERNAQEAAEEIIKKAEAEAEVIKKNAEAEAEKIVANAEADIRQLSSIGHLTDDQ